MDVALIVADDVVLIVAEQLMCLVTGIVCYRLVEQPSQRPGRKVTTNDRAAIERRGEKQRLGLSLRATGD